MLDWHDIIIRLALASFLGALIGIERERKDWAAGLRTHMMVCLGASLIIMVSAFGFSDILGKPDVNLDPSRIAAQVVSGIGFLGAGIIFSKEGIIRGLTTASGLWTVAGIGLATGSGMYIAAVATTIIALFILWGLKPLEEKFFKKYRHMSLKIITKDSIDHALFLKNLLSNESLKIQNFNVEKSENQFVFELKLENFPINKMESTLAIIEQQIEVKEIYWTQ
ncbi:MAG: MgtC/SapB family protein [Bacteroidetes bacterium]|nr:MgtC/SapB family protein [Bacteroidota bacterium]